MKRDFRVGAQCIGMVALFFAGGCAGMQERGTTAWLNLPSPWSTVKNSPAKASASDEEASPAPMKSSAAAKSPPKSKAGSKQLKDDESAAMAMLRGVNHERSGEWDKARAVYEELRKKQPNDMEVVHRLGIVADAQRLHAEAEQLFLLALEREPRNAALLGDLELRRGVKQG